jgi:hypothetical protein
LLDVLLAVDLASLDNILALFDLDIGPFETKFLPPLLESIVW